MAEDNRTPEQKAQALILEHEEANVALVKARVAMRNFTTTVGLLATPAVLFLLYKAAISWMP